MYPLAQIVKIHQDNCQNQLMAIAFVLCEIFVWQNIGNNGNSNGQPAKSSQIKPRLASQIYPWPSSHDQLAMTSQPDPAMASQVYPWTASHDQPARSSGCQPAMIARRSNHGQPAMTSLPDPAMASHMGYGLP